MRRFTINVHGGPARSHRQRGQVRVIGRRISRKTRLLVEKRTGSQSDREAFTLLEIMLVSGMTAFLAILLASSWSNITHSTTDVAARSQLLQELDAAAAALSHDLSGYMPLPSSTPGDYGGVDVGRLVGCRTNAFGDQLELCFDKGPDPDGQPNWTTDAVVRYYLADDPDAAVDTKILIRADDSVLPAKTFVVARCIDAMSISQDGEWTSIQLTFKQRQHAAMLTRQCTFVAGVPQ